MAVKLVTGYSGTEHVTSSDDGARQAGTVGTGMYVLETVEDPLAATLENANTVTVGPGDALVNGRHVRLTGSTTFAVPVGTQGMQTSNLLVLRYSVSEDGTEKAEAVTLTGDPAASDPQDPALATGSIIDGDSPVDMALYRVVTTGIESAQPVRLFSTIPPISGLPGVGDNVLDVAHGGTGMTSEPSLLVNLGSSSAADAFQESPRPGVTGTLPVSRGGTGATSAASARSNLGITPANIGAAASSHNHSASQITSGTLAVARGGTGVTTSAAIGLKAYPVGAVYISYVSTSPASLFGGSWTAITGRFPYFNAGVGTGGSNTHTHSLSGAYAKLRSYVDENNHFTVMYDIYNSSSWSTSYGRLAQIGEAGGWSRNQTGSISAQSEAVDVAGNTSSGNNMPSYQTLYAWRRTA